MKKNRRAEIIKINLILKNKILIIIIIRTLKKYI
jgi:hypothetical protein